MVEAPALMACSGMLLRRLAGTIRKPKGGCDSAVQRERATQGHKTGPVAKDPGLSPKTPIGRHKVKIVSSEIIGANPESRFRFSYRIEEGDHEGKEFSHAFKYLSQDENAQTEGQAIFADLRRATGVLHPADTSDLHDIPLVAIVGPMGRIEYARA
jgi:hypothetical protein